MTDFVSLHNHTSFSILDSMITPKELFAKAKELGQKAIAVTDHGSIAAAWDSLKASKDTGVKLIIGCEMYFVDDLITKKDERFRHVILLAKNAIGYRNLLTLNKEGFDNSVVFAKRVYPLIDWKLLEKYHEGLICLTSCSNGIIAQLLMAKKMEEAERQIKKLVDIFGDDLGLEVQANTLRRGSSAYNDNIEQVFVNAHMVRLGKKHGIKVVATNNAHYVNKEDAEVHDIMLAIGSHQPVHSNFRMKYDCPEFYLKTGDEIKSFFERNFGDFAEELCTNSIYFADKCEFPAWIDPKFSNPSGKELPEFPVKDEADYPQFLEWSAAQSEEVKKLEEDKIFLRYKCELSMRKITSTIDPEKVKQYYERIEEELDVLEFHGFSSYMLIVADYIAWAYRNKIAVGPGRGSVGGSLVAFLLGIHQADPIKYNLIFARFHNKEKSSFPDIDTDFSDRDKVEQYIRQKYGDDHVARVSNINTITPKVYARDIARACEFGGSREKAVQTGTDIANCLFNEIKTIEDALEKVPLFDEYAKKYPQLKKYAAINGKYRAWATHAAGIVISKRPLTGLVPLRRDKDGITCLEYDKDRAEDNGLIKMDLLGLTTLSVIEDIHHLIEKAGKEVPQYPPDYDASDAEAYDIISKGNTFGIFQLGTSSGTIDLCKRIKPKTLNDISYINSLTRPSARDMRNDFILTKDGKRPFQLLHPSLGRAFNNTFGFGLYEESLFFLAQDVAGWNLHSADRLRKLTKEKGKNPKKAAELRTEFIEGAIKNNVNEEIAKRIWDEVIDKFQGYGFNASHSTFYSMLAFTEAQLKAHYPIEFLLGKLMAEVKSGAPTAAANIEKIKKEIRAHKVKITPPDINNSELRYVMRDKKLVTGLDAIKFVSDDAINDVISKRPFINFQDFMARIDSKKVRSNAIQALSACGALDSFGIPRHLIFLYCSDYRKKLQVWMKKHNPAEEEFSYPWPNDTAWTVPQVYSMEQFYLGQAFICGYKDAYGNFFKEGDFTNIAQAKKSKDKTNIKSMKIVIKDFFEFKVKKDGSKYYGQSMIKATMEDVTGEQCGLTIFPDRWQMVETRMQELYGNKVKFDTGLAFHISGNTNFYEDEVGIILDKVYNMCLIPQKPVELKAKKVNLKAVKKEKSETKHKDPNSQEAMFEEIEDEMYDEGLIDLDEEDPDNEYNDY